MCGVWGLLQWFTLSASEREALNQQYRVALFKYKHRNARAKWAVNSSFPDRSVIKAYTQPIADRSTEPVQVTHSLCLRDGDNR